MNAEHPITIPCGPRFKTGPLREFKLAFTASCMAGETAMTCYGPPGVGKSTAMLDIMSSVEHSKKAVIYATEVTSAKGEFTQLARALQTSDGSGLRLDSFSFDQALIRKAQADCDVLGCSRVWLFIDNARHLSAAQMIGLEGTTTTLTRLRMAPFVLLFAGADAPRMPVDFAKRQQELLLNRFLSRKHRMRGLKASEYAEVLRLIDTTRWPEDGPTYTEFLAPEFWQAGGRLAASTTVFQEEFESLAKRCGAEEDELPIKYLISAAVTALIGFRSSGHVSDFKSFIQRAILATTYVQDRRVLGQFALAGEDAFFPRLKGTRT